MFYALRSTLNAQRSNDAQTPSYNKLACSSDNRIFNKGKLCHAAAPAMR